jgi:hypothetical protein
MRFERGNTVTYERTDSLTVSPHYAFTSDMNNYKDRAEHILVYQTYQKNRRCWIFF